MLDSILLGFIAGCWGFVWCRKLAADDFLFVVSLYYKLFANFPRYKKVCEFLAKPLFNCPACNAGWVCIIIVLKESYCLDLGFSAVVVSMATAFFLDNKTSFAKWN